MQPHHPFLLFSSSEPDFSVTPRKSIVSIDDDAPSSLASFMWHSSTLTAFSAWTFLSFSVALFAFASFSLLLALFAFAFCSSSCQLYTKTFQVQRFLACWEWGEKDKESYTVFPILTLSFFEPFSSALISRRRASFSAVNAVTCLLSLSSSACIRT